MKIQFKNVKWDTDGKSFESCGLKSEFEQNVSIDVNFDTSMEELEDMLSDWLSDEFGFCHNGFEFHIIAPTVMIADKAIKDFFETSTKAMIEEDDDWKFIIPFAQIDDKSISIMLLWEGGYDVDDTNKYIDKNGYGINVCLVENGSAPYMEDWKHLSDTMTMNDDYDNIIEHLKKMLEWVNMD